MQRPLFKSLNHCCKRYAFITVPNELKRTDTGFFFEVQDCPYCGRSIRLRFEFNPGLRNVCVSEDAEYAEGSLPAPVVSMKPGLHPI